MIKNTGMVNMGFKRYLIDGFKSGIPPTEVMLTKKNTMLISIKQNPIEYISLLLNSRIFLVSFKKYLGITADPIKNPAKANINVMARLVETEFKASNRNIAKIKSTIKGLKMWFLSILFLFKKFKKFSLGYNFLKKLFTHWPSINPKMVKMIVNKKDLRNSSLTLFISEVKVE